MTYAHVKTDNANDLILKETVQAVDTYTLYPYLRFVADCRKGKGQTNKFTKVTF